MCHQSVMVAATWAIAAMLSSAPARGVLIDQFDGAQSIPPGLSSFIGPGILGGERDVYKQVAGSVDIDAEGNSLLRLVSTGPEGPYIQMPYNGIDVNGTPPGLGGVDLTAGGTHNAIAVRVAFANKSAFFQFHVYTPNGASSAYYPLPGDVLSPRTIYIPFSSFSGSPDFTKVEITGPTISLGGIGSELHIDWIATAQVPEPATAPLAALAFAGLLTGRWWLRKARGN